MIVMKHVRLTVSALRHVMGAARHYDSSSSWHFFLIGHYGWRGIRRAASNKGHRNFTTGRGKSVSRTKSLSVPLFIPGRERGTERDFGTGLLFG